MSYALIAVGAGTAASAGIQYAKSQKQKRAAQAIRPVDPGPNQALIDNARILRDRYGNYQMPGFDAARQDIGQSGAEGMAAVERGAQSSQDVLGAATRIAYGQGRSMSDLHKQNAIGRDNALMAYLGANAQAGTDQTNWGRQQFMNDQQRKAQLANAAEMNEMGAIQQGISGLTNVAAMGFANAAAKDPMTPGSDAYIEQVNPGAEVVRTPQVITPAQYAGVQPSGLPTAHNAPMLPGRVNRRLTPAQYAGITPQNYNFPVYNIR